MENKNSNDQYSHLPDLMTVKEVAKFLRVSPITIKRWGKKGKLVPIRINSRGDRRYTKEQVLWLIGKGFVKKRTDVKDSEEY